MIKFTFSDYFNGKYELTILVQALDWFYKKQCII